MTSGEQDAEFFRERGFGLKMGFGQRPALLVIDLIKAFTDANRPLGADLDASVAVTQTLLRSRGTIAASRCSSPPCAMTRPICAMPASGRSSRKESSIDLAADTNGHLVDEENRLDSVRKTDSILLKKYASCFFGTDLVAKP